MTPYELLITIFRECGSIQKTINKLDELIEELKINKNYANELAEEKVEWAERLNICKICGRPLAIINTYDENRGEYFGTPTQEKYNVYGCEDCNYIAN